MDGQGIISRDDRQRWCLSAETLVRAPEILPSYLGRQLFRRRKHPALWDVPVAGDHLFAMPERDVVRHLFALVHEVTNRLANRRIRRKTRSVRRRWELIIYSRVGESHEERPPSVLR